MINRKDDTEYEKLKLEGVKEQVGICQPADMLLSINWFPMYITRTRVNHNTHAFPNEHCCSSWLTHFFQI